MDAMQAEDVECLDVTPKSLTDDGIAALAHALSTADPADRPILERLYLNKQPDIGIATASALAAAPLHSLSKLSITHGGAHQWYAV